MVSIERFYARLGLQPGASPAAIKRAYRKLAMSRHPDRNKGNEAAATEEFKNIKEAYEVLLELAKRRDERTGEQTDERAAPTWRQRHTPAQQDTTSSTAQRKARQWDWHSPTVQGPDLWGQVYVPLEIALHGGTVDAHLPVTEPCEKCHGESARPTVQRCGHCNGSGLKYAAVRCEHCGGTGKIVSRLSCWTCANSGIKRHNRRVHVPVPFGAWDGQQIVVDGEGAPGRNGGSRGRAIFTVSILSRTGWQRDWLNLSGDVPVDYATATLGGIFEAEVLGKTRRFEIPPNSSSGQWVTLHNEALSDASGNRGHLNLRVVLTLPPGIRQMSPEQRETFKALFDAIARNDAQPWPPEES